MLLAENDWFLAISKFRGLLENAYRGTVFGGPDGTVAPLPDGLGGDAAKWPVLQTVVGLNHAFFTLLRSKAHFLMLPETIVVTLKNSGRVYVSETIPEKAPEGSSGATVAHQEVGSVVLCIPEASRRLAESGYLFGRRIEGSPVDYDKVLAANYGVLVTLYHEMVHVLLDLVGMRKVTGDADFQRFIVKGLDDFTKAVDLNDDPIEPFHAFTESVGYYVGEKTARWLKALGEMDVLLRARLPKSEVQDLYLQDIAKKYDEEKKVDVLVGDKILKSPGLSKDLCDFIDTELLDGLPLTKRFDDTPLARLRASLLR